jgi:hypothetical protein
MEARSTIEPHLGGLANKNDALVCDYCAPGIARIREILAQIRLHADCEIEKWIRIIAVGNIKPE